MNNTNSDLDPALMPAKLPPRKSMRTALASHGQPYVWFAGGMLAISVVMILMLLVLVLMRGASTFWPLAMEEITTVQGQTYLGEVTRTNTYVPREELLNDLPVTHLPQALELLAAQDGESTRYLMRTGNFELTNEHFNWISDFEIVRQEQPEWALIFERLTWGRFYGVPSGFQIDGELVASEPAAIWQQFKTYHEEVRKRWKQRRSLEIDDIGVVNHRLEKARLELRDVELQEQQARALYGEGSREHRKALTALEQQQARYAQIEEQATAESQQIRAEINRLNAENERYELVVTTTTGAEKTLALDEIVRAYPANQLGLLDKLGIYGSRWVEYLTDDPREANSEGGVFPAIFGTVIMTLIMSVCVVPFGVLAALYLREYAKDGHLVSIVRIAVNNLAGVPSIVFGVFGLGFFCYFLGGTIDEIFFSAKLPSPTYGTGGILWASLTLALLTLPVVIVATEEALAAVPSSMREGSYACGASKWQTIRRIVLPRAMPGIMTGMILAMARGAGEVAPLMLVGAVKLAPELPIDSIAPYVHLERSFMHLGFHIYDLGFQSQNSEAAIPMVFTTTLLLICIVAGLNIGAIWLRNRLRRKFMTSQF